jgi:gas vesicle protein
MRYEYEKDNTNATTKLSYLLIGGGIGALLALLFAPKSGTELRGDIADATRKGLDKTKEAAAQFQEKAGEYYEVSREKAGELYSNAQEKAGEYYATAQDKANQLYSNVQDKAADVAGKAKERAGELGEKAKDAAARTTNPISAAIEAGKEAYYDEKRKTETSAITDGRPSYPVEDKVLELPKDTK